MKLPNELVFLKNWNAPIKESKVDFKNKVVLITGATSGIGLVTAHEYAKHGANLIIVARNRDKALLIIKHIVDEFKVKVSLYIADFTNLADVKRAANEIIKENPQIDVLINSVGIHNTKRRIVNGIEEVFLVNHLANFLFTLTLIPHLKKQEHARIINVNSEGHRFGKVDLNDINFDKRRYAGLKSYGQSKTAQLLCMLELAEQLKGSNISINSMHPGAVKSNIGMNNGKVYRLFSKYVTGLILKDPKISARALYYLGTEPELKNTLGVFFNLTTPEEPAKHATDKEFAKKVYELSLEKSKV
jgi:NAD(P)-dependent dehydrogenase (short-subunit alcohol dehydrogenase family)